MKKLLFVFIALLFFVFHSPFHVNAQSSSSGTASETPRATYPLNTNPDVEQNFRTYTQNVFIEALSTATCFIGGVDVLNPGQKCLGIDSETKKIGYVDSSGGLVMAMGNLIGATYNIPVSTSQYVGYLASNFGITENSFARIPVDDGGGSSSGGGFGTGIGFKGLTPVLKIWQAFRNLTYLFFVVVFIILGLGIMFRVNIDARTVMTIQNQIPKIIIALILITLSYAIAGFLIDLMYVAIYVLIHVFDSQGLQTLTNIDTNPVRAIGPFGGINGIAGPAAMGVGGVIESLFDGSIGNWIGGIVTAIIGTFIGNGVGTIFGAGPMGGLIGGVAGFVVGSILGSKILGWIAIAIAYIIISIAILSALFRVWFMLIKAYVFIFLDVIFAPFWIIGGILPGSPGGFGPWIRSLAANLAAFPAVILLFMIGKTIQDQATGNTANFIPPLIGDPGTNSGEAIASLIGLGIILIMPEAVTITKQAFKAPEMKYTAAVGKAIGVGTGIVQAGQKNIKNALWYTNPRTGEAGRLKYLAGKRAASVLDKTPVLNRPFKWFRKNLPKNPEQARLEKTAADNQRRDDIHLKIET